MAVPFASLAAAADVFLIRAQPVSLLAVKPRRVIFSGWWSFSWNHAPALRHRNDICALGCGRLRRTCGAHAPTHLPNNGVCRNLRIKRTCWKITGGCLYLVLPPCEKVWLREECWRRKPSMNCASEEPKTRGAGSDWLTWGRALQPPWKQSPVG